MLFDDACRHHSLCHQQGALKTNKSKSQESRAERKIFSGKSPQINVKFQHRRWWLREEPTIRLWRRLNRTIHVNLSSYKQLYSSESKLPKSYQVSDNNFRAWANRQVQRRSVRRVLDSRVDIGRHANKKQHSLDVYVLYRQVEEVSALGVELEIKVNSTGNNLLVKSVKCQKQSLLYS